MIMIAYCRKPARPRLPRSLFLFSSSSFIYSKKSPSLDGKNQLPSLLFLVPPTH